MNDIHERADEAYFNCQSAGHIASMAAAVDLVIEECAQRAERELIRISDVLAAQVGAAIRALKDKTPWT